MARVKPTAGKLRTQDEFRRRHRVRRQVYAPKTFRRGNLLVHHHAAGSDSFAVVTHKNRPDEPIVSVPVDKSGSIPQQLAILRFLDEAEGSRSGRQRSALVDLGVEADSKVPLRAKTDDDRLAQYLWYMHPNESDLAKIDTPDASWAPPKVDGKRGPTVAIVGAKKEEVEAIRKIIDRSFTQHEKRLMRGVVIEVKHSAGSGIAGFYRKASGSINFDQIVVARDMLKQDPPRGGPQKGETVYDSTLVHELIHFLRARDQKRSGAAARSGNLDRFNRDRDIEETFTDGETIARMKTPSWDRRGDGYYPGDRESQRDKITHDRMLLLNVRKGEEPKHDPTTMSRAGLRVTRLGDEIAEASRRSGIPEPDLRKMWKSKKGLPAVKSTDARFPHLNIARASVRGSKEAIDTYWRLKGKKHTVLTHIHAPNRRPSVAALHRIAAPTDGSLTEYQDGRAVPVDRSAPAASYAAARQQARRRAGISGEATERAASLAKRRRPARRTRQPVNLKKPGGVPGVRVVSR